MRILLRNILAAIPSPSGPVLRDVDISVEEGSIASVGARPQGFRPDFVVDGRQRKLVALPGLINAHVHTDETLGMNTTPEDLRHVPWFRDWAMPYYRAMREDDFYWSALLSQMLMLEGGTTCYADSANVHPELAAKAATMSGMRAFVAKWTCDQGAEYADDVDGCLKATEALLRRFSDKEGRVRALAAVVGANRTSNELYRAIKDVADRQGAVVTSHEASGHEDVVASRKRTGLRPVENLAKIGFLSKKTLLSHLTDISEAEVRMVAKSGTKVVMCPTAELKKGKGVSGFGKIPQIIRERVGLCVGTDTANSSNHLNALRTANLLLLVAKDLAADPALATSRDALRWLTSGAASCLGLRGVGQLKSGAKADISVFELSSLHSASVDPVQALLYGDGPKCVATVVDGRVLFLEGEFTGMNRERVVAECDKRAASIMERVKR